MIVGKDVNVTINGDDVFINDAKVTVADITDDNGDIKYTGKFLAK